MMFFPIVTRLLFILSLVEIICTQLQKEARVSRKRIIINMNTPVQRRSKPTYIFNTNTFVVLKNTTPYRTSDSAYTKCIKTWRLIIPFSGLGHKYSTNAVAVCCQPQLLVERKWSLSVYCVFIERVINRKLMYLHS